MPHNAISESGNQSSETNDYSDYCFCSTWDGDGEIYNRENRIAWRFQTTGLKKHPSAKSSIFSFRDSDSKELAVIYREKRFPLALFNVTDESSLLCTIKQRSFLFTKYDFDFKGGMKWNLYLPMFSIWGSGKSENGKRMLIRIRTRRQWFVRISIGFDSVPMMAALAYIIRKKEQCT